MAVQKLKTIRYDDCWLYAGQINDGGYGVIRFVENYIKRTKSVHRLMYERFKSAIPENLVIDHLCRVRRCINPDHLEPVTQKINVNRGLRANSLKKHCQHGHPFDKTNTKIYANKRQCITCAKNHRREYFLKNGK